MKTIKFHSNNSNEKEFTHEVRKRVRAYFKSHNISKSGNLNLYLKTVVMLAAYFVPFIIILTWPISTLTALFMAILMGIGEAGIGMSVMHDGAHGSYSSKKWINKIMASTMFLLGSNNFNWRVQHNIKHHSYTNIYNYDLDISNVSIIRLCEHAPIKKYHRYQHLYAFPLYGLMTFARLFGEISVLLNLNKTGVTKQLNINPALELIKLISIKIIYLAIIIGLPLILTSFSLWQILIGFIAIHVTAGMIMTTVFQMAHVVEGTHQPLPIKNNLIPHEWMIHELRTTSDFGRKNGLFSWYIGGLDFQIEHHLFQNISHVHYPKIANIVKQTSEEFGLTYNLKPTMFHALGSHYRRLKELGRKK
jgi:linoleoyl-CoA desaturase